jgi:hypothetical protein
MPRTIARKAKSFTQRIAGGQRIIRMLHRADEKELRLRFAGLPPRDRAARIKAVRAEWAGRPEPQPTASTTYYPPVAAGEARGVHFSPDYRYPAAGTFRLATSKGHILATCTIYSDDDADYEAVHATLTAILDQKDPAA